MLVVVVLVEEVVVAVVVVTVTVVRVVVVVDDVILVVVEVLVVGTYALGIITASIMWTTPFEALMSTPFVTNCAMTDPSSLVTSHWKLLFFLTLIIWPLTVLIG